ncbi:MAG: DUF6391 domain-containing protein [Chloroflexota bacterium]
MTTSNRPLTSLLDFTPLSRVRRNHGLEHATLHVLAERMPGKPIAGYSDLGGFWIVGDLDTEALTDAAAEALRRLQSGQSGLAVHPNCGTNFVTAGMLAGGAALMAMAGVGRSRREKLERLPLAISFATLALMVAQPLGLRLQGSVTTCGQPGDLRITEVMLHQAGSSTIHRIKTQG